MRGYLLPSGSIFDSFSSTAMPVHIEQIATVSPVLPSGAAPLTSTKVALPTVTLQSGITLNLDPASKSTPQYLKLLGMLRHAGMAAYLETDPASNTVKRLLIPRVLKVASIASKSEGGRLEVTFRVSHAKHFVSTNHPDYRSIVAALQTALQNQTDVVVTEESHRPEIIDIRVANSPLAFAPTVAPTFAPLGAMATAAIVTPAQAQDMYDLAIAQTCPTNASSATCIPFLYPDDGCWARAHEMAHLMIGAGIDPTKIWIYGDLRVDTSNSPSCAVRWGWHVAPLLDVVNGTSIDEMVIDPSLFSGPVLLSDWIAIQNTTTPPSDLDRTDSSIYQTARLTGSGDLLDPGYVLTARDLNTYRMSLALRCTVENPPGPPYACP